MRRTALWILGIAGGLVALALVAGAIAIWTIDLDRFIAPIRAEVKAATGRDLAVRGGTGLTLWPQPAVVLLDVSLANAPWGRAPALATSRRVEAQIALLPLLSRRFEVVRLEVIEPAIALETDARGLFNWEFAGATPPGIAPPLDTAVTVAPMVLGQLAFRNGTVTFRDGRSGTLVRATIDVITLRARDASSPIDAEFRGKVGDVAIAVTGRLGPYETLRARQWPYPIDLAGDVAGRRGSIVSKVRVDGDTYMFDELILAYASNSFKGNVSVTTGGRRLKVSIYASTKSIRVADLPWVAGAGSVASSGAAPLPFLIPVTPLPLDVLGAADIDLKLETGAVFLHEGWQLNRVDARVVVQDGRLDTPVLTVKAFGGTVAARLTIDATRDDDPSVALRIDARDVDLAALLRAFGVEREVRGATTAIAAEVAGRGRSLHAWASSADGNVLLNVGGGSLARNSSAPGRTFEKLVDGLIPFGADDPSTELFCAVARLSLAGGIARVDRSLAVETAKAGTYASGTLDFGKETINLVFHPQVRQGIPIGLPQVAALVRVEGTFADPQVTIGPMTPAADAVRLGAAIGGSAPVGAPRMPGARSYPGPCAVALEGAGSEVHKRVEPISPRRSSGTAKARPHPDRHAARRASRPRRPTAHV